MTAIDPMEALAKEVIAGRCVAFVGAGFSAAVCRLWHALLAAVATEVKSSEVRAQVEALLAEKNARAYEMAAQILGSTYATLLRDSGSRWLERRFWKRSSRVLKLHGDLRRGTGVTLSRRGYRTRLYSEPGYLHVLRSVLLTKTVLFLGFSFSDEYLNELRSEVLAYLAPEGKTPRYAYALLEDVPPAMLTHFRDHEARHVFG